MAEDKQDSVAALVPVRIGHRISVRVHAGTAPLPDYKCTMGARDGLAIEMAASPRIALPRHTVPIASAAEIPDSTWTDPASATWATTGSWMAVTAYTTLDVEKELYSGLIAEDPAASKQVWQRVNGPLLDGLRSQAEAVVGIIAIRTEPAVILQTWSVYDVLMLEGSALAQTPIVYHRNLQSQEIPEALLDHVTEQAGILWSGRQAEPEALNLLALENAFRAFYRGIQLPPTSVDGFLTVYLVIEILCNAVSDSLSEEEAELIREMEAVVKQHRHYSPRVWHTLKNRVSRIGTAERFSRLTEGMDEAVRARDKKVYRELKEIRNRVAHGKVTVVPISISVDGVEISTPEALRSLAHRYLIILIDKLSAHVKAQGLESSFSYKVPPAS